MLKSHSKKKTKNKENKKDELLKEIGDINGFAIIEKLDEDKKEKKEIEKEEDKKEDFEMKGELIDLSNFDENNKSYFNNWIIYDNPNESRFTKLFKELTEPDNKNEIHQTNNNETEQHVGDSNGSAFDNISSNPSEENSRDSRASYDDNDDFDIKTEEENKDQNKIIEEKNKNKEKEKKEKEKKDKDKKEKKDKAKKDKDKKEKKDKAKKDKEKKDKDKKEIEKIEEKIKEEKKEEKIEEEKKEEKIEGEKKEVIEKNEVDKEVKEKKEVEKKEVEKKEVIDNNEEEMNLTLEINNIISQKDKRTTLMIKNIPNKFNQEYILNIINQNFKGTFDVFVLPTDINKFKNFGYAFINFTSRYYIPYFYFMFNGNMWFGTNSQKICELAYSKVQGKAALLEHYPSKIVFCNDEALEVTPEQGYIIPNIYKLYFNECFPKEKIEEYKYYFVTKMPSL